MSITAKRKCVLITSIISFVLCVLSIALFFVLVYIPLSDEPATYPVGIYMLNSLQMRIMYILGGICATGVLCGIMSIIFRIYAEESVMKIVIDKPIKTALLLAFIAIIICGGILMAGYRMGVLQL